MPVRKFQRENIRMASITSGSTTVRLDSRGIAVGDSIRGPGIPVGATVATVPDNLSITISAAATRDAQDQVQTVGQLANPGSTGNNTHLQVSTDNLEHAEVIALEFEVTAVGGTPTVTYVFQGSMDGIDVQDAASDWFPLSVLPSNSETATATPAAATAVGVNEFSLEIARHPVRKIRVVTSANTNVTYEAEAYGMSTS